MAEATYRIKALEWDRIWYGATANTVFGFLFVSNRQYENDPDSVRWASGVPCSLGLEWRPADSMEDAKADAQRWYLDRLLTALDPA